MKRSTLKAFVACSLSLLLTLLYTSALPVGHASGRVRAQALTKVPASLIPEGTQQTRTVIRTFASYWDVGEDYTSTLIVRNADTQSSVSVTPIIFTESKEQIRLAALHLAPNEVKKISMKEAVRKAGSQSESGALALEMSILQSASIIAEMIITSYQEGVIFDLPVLAGYANDGAKALHASWWLPDDGTDGELILFNASEDPIAVHPSVTIRKSQHALADVSLASHEIKKLGLRDMVRQSGEHGAETGSISLSYDGPPHALLPALLIDNGQTGFSLTGKFFAKPSGQPSQSDTTNWYYPLVLTGKSDPALGFKKGDRFTPYALISNPTSVAITPRLDMSFAYDGEPGQSVSLQIRPLAPMETRLVDLSDVTKQLLPGSIRAFSLQLSHQGTAGDLALHLFSMEQKKNFVFNAEGTLQTRSRLDSVYWNIADDLQAILVVHNTGEDMVQAEATLSFDKGDGSQGTYKLPPVELKAQATGLINLRQAINSGRPDESGTVIPVGTSFGSVTVRVVGGQGDVLTGGSVTFDPDAGQYGIFFLPMCSPSGPQFAFPGFPFGIEIYLDGIELPPCDFWFPIIIITVCELFCDFNPGVPPRIDSITPDRALIGQPVDVVIRGSFFGNNPSLIVDAGIAVSVTSSSDTQINARFNISATDTGGNHAVFVENSQGISNAVNFFVQKPASLSVLSVAVIPPEEPGGCPDFGVRVAVLYQVLDQDSPPRPIRFDGMEPKETLTEFFVNGAPGNESPTLTNVGPTVVPGTSRFTDANGQFLDAPVGNCVPFSNTFSVKQRIFIDVGVPYITRENNFSGSSSSPGTGTITNRADIQAERQ